MKKYILIFTATAFVLQGCSDFLKENLTTSLGESRETGTEVYDTPQTVEAHVNGCTRSFTATLNGYAGRWHEYINTASGLIHWKGNRNTNIWISSLWLSKFSDDGSYVLDFYKSIYAGIYRCNKLIDAMNTKCPLDEKYRRQIEAEARFYRAVHYFTAVRLFGDVILVTEPAADIMATHQPRTSYSKVYVQIVQDLKFAFENMRSAKEQMEATGNPARPNNWAAEAYLAAVYLQIGSLLSSPEDNFWDNTRPERCPDLKGIGINTAEDAMTLAYNTAVNVIENGPYELCPTYAQLFNWTNAADFLLKERIFVIESNNRSTANIMATYAVPQYIETSNVSASNWGRMRPSRFLFQKWCEAYNGTYSGTCYTDCKDPRLGVTMWYNTYHSDIDGDVEIYPASSCLNTTNDTKGQAYFKKYWDSTYNNTGGNGDLYMMRLAEMYLTAAEAAASLSTSYGDSWCDEAIKYVNFILARARQTEEGEAAEPQDWTVAKFADTNELIHAIIWEREFEMAFEGHEFFDTHRRGAAFLRDHIAVPTNEFLHLAYQKSFVKRAYQFTTQFPETAKYKDQGFDQLGLGYPESIENLRKSLICGFPQAEVEYNNEISTQSQKNDFDWRNN